MKTVTLTNPGEIERVAIKTMGVNVKEGDNPIGRFGTGLKNALSILLRSGHEVKIWSGGELIQFGLQSTEIRGKNFELVTMDGEPMGFTTLLGRDWEIWEAFRELYCNCIDEGGTAYSGQPRAGDLGPGRTVITVAGDAFHEVYKNREDYVISTEPAARMLSMNVHLGKSQSLYYRGVRVYELPRPAMFRYNIQDSMSLTENRTLRSVHEAQIHIAWSICASREPDIIRQAITAGENYFEHTLDFNSGALIVGETFRSVLAEVYHSKKMASLNPTASRLYGRMTEIKRDKYAAVNPNPVEAVQLERAKQVVRALGMEPDNYRMTFVESLGAGILGEARNGQIYLSRRAANMGTKTLAGTLYEEMLHIRDDLVDESRSMQNHLIDEVMTLIERHVLKEPI